MRKCYYIISIKRLGCKLPSWIDPTYIVHGRERRVTHSANRSNTAILNADAQTLSGAILVGSDSTLSLNLTNSSSFEGCIDGKITNAAGTVISAEAGTVSVSPDDSSTWVLTGDSYVTEWNGNAANIISNGYTLYVNGVALNGTN